MKKQDIMDFELLVAKLLRYGVLLVGVVLAVGWILSINLNENIFLEYQNYTETNLFQTLELAWANKEWGLLLSYFGLSLLILLPLLRVTMTCILFAKEKEYTMMGISLLVLVGLALSFFLGAVK